jgi:hypothetical protein
LLGECRKTVWLSPYNIHPMSFPEHPYGIFIRNLIKKPKPAETAGFHIIFGGEAGIRTRARVAPTNGLANRPLQPTWVLLLIMAERLGFEPRVGLHLRRFSRPVP